VADLAEERGEGGGRAGEELGGGEGGDGEDHGVGGDRRAVGELEEPAGAIAWDGGVSAVEADRAAGAGVWRPEDCGVGISRSGARRPRVGPGVVGADQSRDLAAEQDLDPGSAPVTPRGQLALQGLDQLADPPGQAHPGRLAAGGGRPPAAAPLPGAPG